MAAATIELTPQELQGLCQRYLKDEQQETELQKPAFEVVKYTLKSTSDAPAGYLGRHQFLNVEISLNGRSEKLTFFTKSAPSEMASRMAYLEEFGVFKKEIRVYREVLPNLQKIFSDMAPKCYYANKNLLVFENLGQQGYKMAAGRDGLLNYEHLNCMLKTLAAMHAGSIAYERRMGRKISELHPETVQENAYPSGITPAHVRYQNFHNGIRVLKEMIKAMPKYSEKLEFILANVTKQMEKIFELVQVSSKYQNVFSHGDLWANNVMFQYGKFGETPLQARIVDFQLARYAPPMLDLITILTIPTSRSFRSQYMTELLCNYYRFMTDFLKREHINWAEIMPSQLYAAGVDEFRICGLIESFLFSHLTILPPGATQNLTGSADGFSDFFDSKRVEISMQAFHTDDTYRERLTDMIEDLVDNFVLCQ